MFLGNPLKANAATAKTVKLSADVTYKKYDITGNGKKDSLTIKSGKDRDGNYNSLSVVLNGKTVYSLKKSIYFSVDIRLYTLQNRKSFLFLYADVTNYDGPVCGIFQYKNGKLSQIINFQKLFANYGSHNYGEVIDISGNSLTVQYYSMSWSLGPSCVNYTYTYKDGTLKRTSNTARFTEIYSAGKDTKTFYANKNLTAYTSASAQEKAFTVKKGKAVVVDKCYANGKVMFIRVKYNGKYGWIKGLAHCPTKDSDKLFSNVTYAG
jgi:hypothetical protein